jgi:hypothetical protein
MIIKNKSSKHDTQHTQNTLNIQNTQNYMKKSDLDLEETENIQNELPTKAISKSAMLKQPRQYEWDKYNTDFNYLC